MRNFVSEFAVSDAASPHGCDSREILEMGFSFQINPVANSQRRSGGLPRAGDFCGWKGP
jgi:hypothetical protein